MILYACIHICVGDSHGKVVWVGAWHVLSIDRNKFMSMNAYAYT
jgi:hypothetical protein